MRALVALLVASLLANVYLMVRRRGAATETAAAPLVEAPVEPPRERAFVPSPQHRASYAVLERKLLEQRVLAAEAEVERHRPMPEKFALAQPSPETEARARPYLDAVFGGVGYTLVCHGSVCKLDAEAPRKDWMEPLQTRMPDRLTLFRGMQFDREGTFLDLTSPGEELMAKMIHVAAAAAIRTCLADPPSSGDITLQLAMDAARVVVKTSGSLVDQPIGRCLVKAYEDAIGKVPVPPGVEVEDEGRTFAFPLGT